MNRPRPLELLRHPELLIGSGFGSGLAPLAPGTVGSLAALLPWWLWLRHLPPLLYLLILLLACAVGVVVCSQASRRTRQTDPSWLVWDEFAGCWLTLFALPQGWPALIMAVGLFRAFDILKPWPIQVLERRLPRGWGVMADDLMAAMLSWLILHTLALPVFEWLKT